MALNLTLGLRLDEIGSFLGGGGSTALANIIYNFDTYNLDELMAFTIDNRGSDAELYDAPRNASNHVSLGAGQYVDLPTVDGGYRTHYDVGTKTFVTTPTVGTTYRIEESFSTYFTTDIEVTTDDLTAMKTNPNLIYEVYEDKSGSVTLPSGLDYTNIINLMGAKEGINGGYIIHDLCNPQPAFKYTWRTTASNETCTLPLVSGMVQINVDWGDGTSDYIDAFDSPLRIHEYAIAGDYQISINGVMEKFAFNNGGDRLKVVSVEQLGDPNYINLTGFMRGCSNIVNADFGEDYMGNVTTMPFMMDGWSSITVPPDVSSWDVSNVTTMYFMMHGWSNITVPPDMSLWDVSNVTTMDYMMHGWSSCIIDDTAGIHLWTITALTSASYFAGASTIATATLDKILINWEAQSHKPNVTIHFGNSNYTLGGAAETAYNALVADGWTISSNGGI